MWPRWRKSSRVSKPLRGAVARTSGRFWAKASGGKEHLMEAARLLLEPGNSAEWRPVYRYLTALVQPRPIAWVSSVSADGQANLAPFSFFNVVCAKPATIAFSPMLSGPQAVKKDTVKNIELSKEFVVQVVSRKNASAMNLTSAEVDARVDEFELAGLEKLPGRRVSVPRVAQAQAWMECRLNQIVWVGEGSGSGCLIMGEVVCIEIDDALLLDDRVDLDLLDPIGRLSGSDYCGVKDRFSLQRPDIDDLSSPGRQ